MIEQKKHRPRWCPRCKELREWQKIRLMGARASFKACVVCQARTQPRKPGTKKAVPRPGSYRVVMNQCDDIARARAKTRGSCEHCGASADSRRLEWAHGFSRNYHAIRHIDDNGRLLCYKCHTHFTNHYEEWRDWLEAKIGAERFEYLRIHRNDKITAQDLLMTLEVLRSGAPCVAATGTRV